MHGLFDFDELVNGICGVSLDATLPVEISSPTFDGAQGGANVSGHRGVAAPGPELQIGAEGFKGAVGFAFGLTELGRSGGRFRRHGAGSRGKIPGDRRRPNCRFAFRGICV